MEIMNMVSENYWIYSTASNNWRFIWRNVELWREIYRRVYLCCKTWTIKIFMALVDHSQATLCSMTFNYNKKKFTYSSNAVNDLWRSSKLSGLKKVRKKYWIYRNSWKKYTYIISKNNMTTFYYKIFLIC